jgi:hypothetical protein
VRWAAAVKLKLVLKELGKHGVPMKHYLIASVLVILVLVSIQIESKQRLPWAASEKRGGMVSSQPQSKQ